VGLALHLLRFLVSPMTPREAELTRQLEAALSALHAVQRENELLREKVALLVQRIFGSSSEKLSPGQLELALGLVAETEFIGPPMPPLPAPAPDPKPRTSRTREPRAPRIPDDLPVVEQVLEPAEVLAAPQGWRRIGEEVSDQLDYEPGHFLRRRLIRPRYVKRVVSDSAPVIAALPPKLQDRSLPAAGLLAFVIVSKYCDHLPLYRQSAIFATRHKIIIPRQTLCRWMGMAAGWLEAVYRRIRTGVMEGRYLQIDETPVEYLDPGRGRTAQGYLWTCARPGGDVVFHWETSRGTQCISNVLPVDFSGTLQCDGYAAYEAFARRHPQPITLAGCWAHVRRKFNEAFKRSPRQAGWILRQIQALYRVEARMREQRAGRCLREAVRASESRMIVERLHRALSRLQSRHLPKSAMGKAISYALGQWDGLVVYLGDGRVEIDNNTVENAIRPTAVGKKNWLFVGDGEAGDRGAILYTVVESCRRRGIDPYEYLRDVLERIPGTLAKDLESLTPSGWAAARAKKQTLAA
jgi:transposase